MKKQAYFIIGIILLLIIAFFVYQKLFIPKELTNIDLPNQMKIKSVFNNNEKIPEEFTCDGDNTSPPLEITDIPKNTKTLAIISDDPDAPAGTWVHWIVWNIKFNGNALNINEGESPGTEGTTSFKKIGYGGPCPPSGTHHYFFKVYALDSELSLGKGATKQQLEAAMKGHILDKTELIGLYSRV